VQNYDKKQIPNSPFRKLYRLHISALRIETAAFFMPIVFGAIRIKKITFDWKGILNLIQHNKTTVKSLTTLFCVVTPIFKQTQ
tara:strand:+ start:1554 stop:1802 length:249 start_codon:yes stop_codon:yes gene_type:complete